ncbi:beta-galactosidase [Sphingobacterium mizutaii NBRC 14946 = DSM 11724]|uniref:Beta-galactosidase n=2 Tax=Sphingobacterium mizutaii TaxID=1010 RepID=A0AAJ4X8X8_9SPHI|nr:glycoside hydrolase family 2 TIM barrel-domain containing protein [Sphingobacterium mizutaii]GEM70019.1 beta-galactosidase [Sphingobacterium mizutaii NBRC 14946 = DSM 11724]SDL90782.1 beta-galactosidase [Sphingobacterium mizutaii]SNV41958.1 Beta-galactosidase [Sphingobacterium mizutaii]
MIFRKEYLLMMVGLLANSIGFAQSRMEKSFNEGWKFYKANNSTFFTDFENGQKYFENQGQWTKLEIWEDITLPHTYNKDDMQKDRNFFEGKAVYQKTFHPDEADKNRRTFLKFEGVGAVAQLFVNGNYIGEHKGGYSMFVFEISNSIEYGKDNSITVIADNKSRKDIIPINHFLFPVYGGIYRPVHLITTNKTNFVVTDQAAPGIFIRQKNVSSKSADIQVEAKLETKEKTIQEVELSLEIKDDQGKTVETQKYPVKISPQGVTYVNETIKMKSPHLWDGIRDPYLYSLTAKITANGKELDAVKQPLGIRHIEMIANKGVFLNGKKYPMYGVTRHQDREGFGSALSFEQHKEDMMLIKEMGATTIRLAHYQQSPQMYALADSIGFLTWAEIPFVNRVSYYENDNAKQQMVELVKQNFNHPSIYIWGVHNEVYSKTADEQVPVLSRELNDIAKTLDPDRYTVAVTGYNVIDRQENLSTDVQGINHYFGWYGGKIEDLGPWAQKVQKDFPEYKIILSEYGADGNIDIGKEEVEAPKDVISGKAFPENYQTETHIQQWAAIEKNPIILASYLWNSFEFAVPAWNRGGVNARNLKGLITFDRKRKKDSFYWYKANWNPEPMIYLANRRDSIRTHKNSKIQLFSNLSKVQLIVNGKEYQAKQGVNSKHWVVDNVELKQGENKIQAKGNSGNEVLTDEMTWTLQ